MRHLIEFGDMTREEWEGLYDRCEKIMASPGEYTEICRGRLMASLFYEPSTRTNFSFQSAMLRLGGSTFGFADPRSSSTAKGESLRDTVSMVSGYADVIVIRSPWEGAAKAASLYAAVPVVNAGDGGHMHPTQTLTDLTTITHLRGSAEGVSVGLCGDLKYGRTVHSLVKALCDFAGVRFTLISPRELAIPDYLRRLLREKGVPFTEVEGLEEALGGLDVLYMTRIQQERFESPEAYERNKGIYVLRREMLKGARDSMLILHPLPRVDEIAADVDEDPRAVYFDQARYGMFARMSLLSDLANQPRCKVHKVEHQTDRICRNPRCITASEPYLPRLLRENGGEACCGYCDAPFV